MRWHAGEVGRRGRAKWCSLDGSVFAAKDPACSSRKGQQGGPAMASGELTARLLAVGAGPELQERLISTIRINSESQRELTKYFSSGCPSLKLG